VSLHQLKKRIARVAGRMLDLDRRVEAKRGRYVMCYHRVISARQAADEWVHSSMWISPQAFEEQVRWMSSVGEIVSHDRVLDFNSDNKRPLFALTFDDGWRDNYDQALPILRRHGVTATVYLATACMDDGRLIWPEDLMMKTRQASVVIPEQQLRVAIGMLAPQSAQLPTDGGLVPLLEAAVEQLKLVTEMERGERIARYCEEIGAAREPLRGHMITWDQAREMLGAGVTLGSHTHTHRICSESTPEQIEQELVVSRERIRTMLGCEVDSFAYPNARYHGSEAPILERSGYRSAFRIHNLPVTRGIDRFFAPRLIGNESTCAAADYFKLRLLGAY
jgi:peptidoglycan/xylan/chitin deacetylase (PgdA/CDA1 family)